jgi:CBS domain containing-hemolysin-like protein
MTPSVFIPDPASAVKVVLYVLLLGGVAFCSAVETALLRRGIVPAGMLDASKPVLSVWEDRPDAVLGMLLALANVANVGIGVITVSLGVNIWWTIAAVLVFGEILPKVYALHHAPFVVRFGLCPVVAIEAGMRPVVQTLAAAGARLAWVLTGGRRAESPFLTRDELREIIATVPAVAHEEQVLYRNIVDLAEKRVYEVMSPRESIVAVDADEPKEDLMRRLASVKYSRVPVYRGSLDTIVGVLYTKDITVAVQSSELIVLDDLIRPPVFVINTAQVVDVLKQFKQGRHHLAIVVDEYGATVGLVTIEDILEEIFGEIYDEYDVREQHSRAIDARTFLIDGVETLRNVNVLMHSDFQENEVVTFSGYVITRLGRVPSAGERIRFGDFEIEVIDASRTMIHRMQVRRVADAGGG